jgi:hypothetical protein
VGDGQDRQSADSSDYTDSKANTEKHEPENQKTKNEEREQRTKNKEQSTKNKKRSFSPD